MYLIKYIAYNLFYVFGIQDNLKVFIIGYIKESGVLKYNFINDLKKKNIKKRSLRGIYDEIIEDNILFEILLLEKLIKRYDEFIKL